MQITIQYLHRSHCRFYVLIYVEINSYMHILESRYDKILKT